MHRVKRTYTFYKETNPNEKLAELYITETIHEKTGSIKIINKDLAPILAIMAYKKQNNIIGVEAVLEDRAMQPNRMFFAEYCKEQGLNPDSLDDRLKISHGKKLGDDYYIEIEEEYT